MNKKLWTRCLMAGVLSMSLFVVAGCGESKEDKQARFEKAQQEALAQDRSNNVALTDKISKADTWKTAINKLKERGELKTAPIQVSGDMTFDQKAFKIDVVKSGTTELLRYQYDLEKQTWSDGAPVDVVGPGKNDIAQTFYSIDNLNPDMMATVIESFKKEGQSNPELKDTYTGFITKAGMGWGPKSQKFLYFVNQIDSEGGGLESDKIIEATYDETGKAIKLKVKPKGSKERKNLIK